MHSIVASGDSTWKGLYAEIRIMPSNVACTCISADRGSDDVALRTDTLDAEHSSTVDNSSRSNMTKRRYGPYGK